MVCAAVRRDNPRALMRQSHLGFLTSQSWLGLPSSGEFGESSPTSRGYVLRLFQESFLSNDVKILKVKHTCVHFPCTCILMFVSPVLD